MDYKRLLNETPFELSKKELVDRITLLLSRLSKEKILILYLEICYEINGGEKWLIIIDVTYCIKISHNTYKIWSWHNIY